MRTATNRSGIVRSSFECRHRRDRHQAGERRCRRFPCWGCVAMIDHVHHVHRSSPNVPLFSPTTAVSRPSSKRDFPYVSSKETRASFDWFVGGLLRLRCVSYILTHHSDDIQPKLRCSNLAFELAHLPASPEHQQLSA